MPFTMNQKTYTDNLVQLLNNTVPIIVSSITIGNATSLPPSSAPPPSSSSNVTGQDRNIIIITTVITLCSLVVAGGYILYLTRKDDDDDNNDDANAERITVDGLPFDDSSEQYHVDEEDAYYYHYGGSGSGGAAVGGARREQSLRGGEQGHSSDHHPGSIPPNPTYTATLTSARSSGQPSRAPEPPLSSSSSPPIDSFHQSQRGRTTSGSSGLAPSLVYGGTGSNGSQAAASLKATATGSEMDGGSSVSTGGRGRDTTSNTANGGTGSWTMRDESGGSGNGVPPFSNPHNNSYPTISTLPISVINEGGGGLSSAHRGMRDVDEDDNNNNYYYSPSNEYYGNYLHHEHHRPRLSDADMQPLPTIPSMPDTREGELDEDGMHSYHGHQLDEQRSRNKNDISPPPPHLMSGFQLTIEDLDDM